MNQSVTARYKNDLLCFQLPINYKAATKLVDALLSFVDEIKLDASGTFEFLPNSLRVNHVFKDSHLDEFKVSYIRNMLKISTNLLLGISDLQNLNIHRSPADMTHKDSSILLQLDCDMHWTLIRRLSGFFTGLKYVIGRSTCQPCFLLHIYLMTAWMQIPLSNSIIRLLSSYRRGCTAL